MSDELHNAGGEGGGQTPEEKLVLSRSELMVLRRMASRYPIKEEDRGDVVDIVMHTLRTSKSRRNKLAAAKTIAALDQVNLREVKMALDESKKEPAPAPVTVNNTVVVQTVTVEGVLSEYADVIEESRVPGEVPASNGTGKQVHPAKANGKAS